MPTPFTALQNEVKNRSLSPEQLTFLCAHFDVEEERCGGVRIYDDFCKILRSRFNSKGSTTIDFTDKKIGNLGSVILGLSLCDEGVPSCSSLKLKNCQIDEFQILAHLLVGTNVSNLDISSNDIKTNGLEITLLCLFKQLYALSVGHGYITKIRESLFSKCESLKNLNISYNSINEEGLEIIANSVGSHLHTLNLGDCEIEEIEERIFMKFKHLKILNIDDNMIGNTGFDIILKTLRKTLQTLEMSCCNVTRVNYDLLKQCRYLFKLDISRNLIGSQGLETILNCLRYQVHRLDLWECGINCIYDTLLRDCENMYWLDLREEYDISDEQWEKLANVIKSLPALKTVKSPNAQIITLMHQVNSYYYKLCLLLLSIRSCDGIGEFSSFKVLPIELIKMIIQKWLGRQRK